MNLLLISSFLSLAVFAQSPPTEAQLKKALLAAPRSFAANHNLGEFYIRQGRLLLAIPYLEKAQQADPKHYANRYDLALAYVLTGNEAKARAQIKQTLAIKETAELHALLGEVEEKAGDVPAAAAAYHRAAEIEPSEKHLLSLGNLLLKSSNFDEAIRFFEYGLQKFPRSAPLKIGLGIAEYSQGKYERAVRTLCDAADLDPADHRPYLFLGEMYGVSAEMAEEIIARMAKFVELHPENSLAHFYYALNVWKGRRGAGTPPDLALVEKLLKEAIRLDPKYAPAYFQLGSLYVNESRLPEAIERLEQAVRLEPKLVEAHYRLGQAYQKAGRAADAARELEIFRRLKEKSS